MEIIQQYFPDLSDKQFDQFSQLKSLYEDWNAKINVISRKDIDNLYTRHVLHSLAIAKMVDFTPGTTILDLGTGGGFPGIPCAILFPKSDFTLIDGTRKKIHVVNEVAQSLNLENVKGIQKRAEEHKAKYDFIITRAVATIDKLWTWSRPLLHTRQKNAIPNGLIALKGGNIKKEMKLLHRSEYYEVHPISRHFSDPFFEDKYLVYVQY
jgi:16S rRNA (guanine527-N7)-methyltransferase